MTKPQFFQKIIFTANDPLAVKADISTLLGERDLPTQLGNTQITIEQAEPKSMPENKSAMIKGLVLHSDNLANITDTRGLHLQASQEQADVVLPVNPDKPGIQTVDHVVLTTNDANDCIRLFGDELGMRLALDQTVEKWNARMLFFREGSMTLEVIERLDKLPARDTFWGISYRVGNLKRAHELLVSNGVLLSEIRPGRKPGTEVATVKSHNGGIETLLVGNL